MNIKKILLIVLMIPCLASASNWVAVSKKDENQIIFVDTQSIQRSGDSVTFWEKTNFPTRGENGELSLKANATINCRTSESILKYFMFYDDLDNKGKLTNQGPAPASVTWEPIAPDTVGETVMQFVCKK